MKPSFIQVAADRADRPDELIASGRQVEMRFPRGKRSLSLRAGKLFHLLVKAAGEKLGENIIHELDLTELRDLGHLPIEERRDLIIELQSTIVEVMLPKPYYLGFNPNDPTDETNTQFYEFIDEVESSPLLIYVRQPLAQRGSVKFQFSPVLLPIFSDSDYWAILNKRAVMAFESRYSLRLYEIMALRSGLNKKTSEVFDLDNLRNRLGVPTGKLSSFHHFRQKALEPAIAEVNQLAGFNVDYEAIKRGRAVAFVKLTWGEKSPPERKATKRELDGSKIGRKARREGMVETIVEFFPSLPAKLSGFPSDGSISFGKWGRLVRQHAPKPTPDVDMIASAFRKWAREKAMPLESTGVEKSFIGFCKKFKASV